MKKTGVPVIHFVHDGGGLLEIVKDELNIKDLVFVKDSESLLSYKVMPNNQILGPKYGADFPKIKSALSSLDPDKVAALVNNGEAVPLELDGKTIALEPEEVLIDTEGKILAREADTKPLKQQIENALDRAL